MSTESRLALERENERLSLLTEAAAALLAADDPVRTLDELFETIAARFEFDGYFHFMASEGEDRLELVSCSGVAPEVTGTIRTLAFGQAVCGKVALTRQPIHATAVQSSDDPAVALVKSIGVRAYICRPLLAGGRLIGTLSFFSRAIDRFCDEDLALLATVSHYVAIAEDRVRLARLAEVDAERMRVAAESGGFGVYDIDLVGGRYYWCDQMRAILGLPADAEATEYPAEGLRFVHADDRERVDALARSIREPGGPETIEVEHRIVRPGGEVRWVLLKGRVHRARNGHDRPVRLSGILLDLTEARRQAEAVQQRERELQTLADNSPCILVRFDRELRHVFVNAAIERSTGRKPAEFIGRTNEELGLAEDLCDLWNRAVRAVFDTGEPQDIAYEYPNNDGDRHYTASIVPERGRDGRIEYALAVIQDRTAEKSAEDALLEADRRKDEFLATLAHELRNPLAPIRNGMQVLRLAPADGEVATRTLEMMDRQLSHMVRLVDDLLDVGRISRGKLVLRRERVQVREVLDAAAEGSLPALQAGRHAFFVTVDDEPLWLDADATRLAQVVGNLLTNAAKYTPDGGRIELSATREGDEAVVRVTDTGIGLAPEMLSRIWEMFIQVGRDEQRSRGGLGIGLWLVRRIVEMHGGAVSADSAGLGRGSTFSVRLPLARTEVTSPGRSSDAANAPGHRRRVLVVDDNEDGAESLALMLELDGHLTRTAFSGPDALEAARAFLPEVAFLDIGLPGMDGYEVARRFRADPSLAGAVLVAVTGWGGEDDKRRALRAGFDLHLTKPVDVSAVEDVLLRLDDFGSVSARDRS